VVESLFSRPSPIPPSLYLPQHPPLYSPSRLRSCPASASLGYRVVQIWRDPQRALRRAQTIEKRVRAVEPRACHHTVGIAQCATDGIGGQTRAQRDDGRHGDPPRAAHRRQDVHTAKPIQSPIQRLGQLGFMGLDGPEPIVQRLSRRLPLRQSCEQYARIAWMPRAAAKHRAVWLRSAGWSVRSSSASDSIDGEAGLRRTPRDRRPVPAQGPDPPP